MSFSKYIVATSTSGGKFWEVEVDASDMRIRYGKLGADPKWSTKTFESNEKAEKEATKKFNSKIKKGYAEAPRPSEVSADGVVLAESSIEGVFYFRAFERPGGNRDEFTIKLTLSAEPGESPNLLARSYHNWDGEHWIYPEVEVPYEDLGASVSTLLDAAQKLIDGGLNESGFIIIDPRDDSEEDDTEWSSLEFSISVKDGTDKNLAVHVMQKALSYTNQKGSPPDEDSQAFIDAVHAAAGIGRVKDNSENEDRFTSTFNPLTKGESQGFKTSEVPLYP